MTSPRFHDKLYRQSFVGLATRANHRIGAESGARDLALRPTLDFLKTEAGGGAALIAAAVLALFLANSPWAGDYFALVQHPSSITIGGFSETLSIQAWIKDGLMAVFFFVVGLALHPHGAGAPAHRVDLA